MIEVEHLIKTFGRTRAVRDVSFSAAPGEIVGLLGPNGSGKTTIMRILAGFFPPSSGRALVAGLDVAAHGLEARRHVGYLPENPTLYPEMRVRAFLRFCAAARRLPSAEAKTRVDRVLADCGLEDVCERLIRGLSKGYRQRVGLAQSLLHDPRVLILDEPTVGLDPNQVLEVRRLIRALRGRTTVLLSSHILAEVGKLCERVVILHRGRILAQGAAHELNSRIDGEERILVRISGPSEPARGVLAAVPGVHRVEAGNVAEDGAYEFVVFGQPDAAVRHAIAAAIVSRGWGLAELRPLAPSLEDLFVRLVAGDAAAGSGKRAGEEAA